MKLICFLILVIFISSCDSGNTASSYESSYEEKKTSLEDKEKANPESFIDVNYTYRQNLIDQWVLEGTIRNEASIATFKDVTMRVHFYSKTDTDLGTQEKTIFEYFEPGSTRDFKLKFDGYEDATSVKLEILNVSSID